MTKLFDLISYNRKGKIASCWNAATTNEILFRNFYGSAHIQKINIEETCNEILKEIKNNPPTLNLQQASQLMYGVIKIFKDQVMKYEKDVFETMKKLFSKPKKESVNQFISDLGIDLSLPNENHLISRLTNTKDLHLLQEVDLEQNLFMEAQTRLDFGALTNEEMDVIIDKRNMSESISLITRAKDSVNWETDMINDIKIAEARRNSVNRERDMINDIEITEEVHRERHMSQEPSSQFVSVVNVEERREGLSLTPQKRQPRHVQAETPTKRRRLSFETAVATDVPPENVTVPEIYVTEAALVLPLPTEKMPGITELEQLEIERNERRPKKLIIDKKIILKNDVIKQWQQNTRIYCGKLDQPKLYRVNAKDLFKQPAKRWGITLKEHMFDKYIAGPFTRTTEDFTLPAVQEAPEQVIRTSPMENSRNISRMEHSSFAIDNSTAHNTLIQPTIVNARIQEVEETSAIQLATESIPHITTLEDNTNIESHQDQEKTDENPVPLDAERQSLTAEDCMPIPLQVGLTLDEILAMVEEKMQNKSCIKFEELIPNDKYSKEEAAITFYLLLVAHVQKKITLRQEACFDTLYIYRVDPDSN